jgi:hypothetical protein
MSIKEFILCAKLEEVTNETTDVKGTFFYRNYEYHVHYYPGLAEITLSVIPINHTFKTMGIPLLPEEKKELCQYFLSVYPKFIELTNERIRYKYL